MKALKGLKKDYWLFWFASSLGMGASNILQYVLSLYVLDLTGSATLFASMLSIIIPRLLLTPLAGVMADRAKKSRLMALILLGEATVLGVYFVLGQVTTIGIALIYVLVIVLEAGEIFYGGCEAAILPELVPPEKLKDAISVSKVDDGVVNVAAPLGGSTDLRQPEHLRCVCGDRRAEPAFLCAADPDPSEICGGAHCGNAQAIRLEGFQGGDSLHSAECVSSRVPQDHAACKRLFRCDVLRQHRVPFATKLCDGRMDIQRLLLRHRCNEHDRAAVCRADRQEVSREQALFCGDADDRGGHSADRRLRGTRSVSGFADHGLRRADSSFRLRHHRRGDPDADDLADHAADRCGQEPFRARFGGAADDRDRVRRIGRDAVRRAERRDLGLAADLFRRGRRCNGFTIVPKDHDHAGSAVG